MALKIMTKNIYLRYIVQFYSYALTCLCLEILLLWKKYNCFAKLIRKSQHKLFLFHMFLFLFSISFLKRSGKGQITFLREIITFFKFVSLKLKIKIFSKCSVLFPICISFRILPSIFNYLNYAWYIKLQLPSFVVRKLPPIMKSFGRKF